MHVGMLLAHNNNLSGQPGASFTHSVFCVYEWIAGHVRTTMTEGKEKQKNNKLFENNYLKKERN